MKRVIVPAIVLFLSFGFAQETNPVTIEQLKAQIALLDVRLKNVEQYQLEQRGVPTQLVRIENQVGNVSTGLTELKASLKESSNRNWETFFSPAIAVGIGLVITGIFNNRQKQRTQEARDEMRDELERIEEALQKLSKKE